MLHHKGDAVVYYLTESCENGVNVYGIKGHDLEYRSLCTDRDAVAALVRRCNEGDLAPWQLPDVVEDFAARLSFPDPLL